jgi:glucose-1-phosphate adenylyltransferase
MMGIDYYQTLTELQTRPHIELLGVGENCLIKRTIIDKNAKIGDNCKIIGHNSLEDTENEAYSIKQGIIIINKGAVIPANTEIGYRE